MKRTVLIFAALTCFLFPGLSFCQDFAPLGATWWWNGESDFFGNYFTFGGSMQVDSIAPFQGQNCSFIGDYKVYSDSGRVYHWNAEDSLFYKLFDFNLNVGDSWQLYVETDPTDTFPSDTMTATVFSVDSVEVNGVFYKQQYIRLRDMEYNMGPVVERVGSRDNFLPYWDPGFIDPGYSRSLRCYQDSVMGLWHITYLPSCNFEGYWVGVEDVMGMAVSVGPNPAREELVIQWQGLSGEQLAVGMYDLVGREVYWDEKFRVASSGELLIPLSVPAGTYLLRVMGAEGVISRKVIVD